jgi:uncharacterized protein (DUF305 family)
MKKSLIMGGVSLAATAALLAGCSGGDTMSGMTGTQSSSPAPAPATQAGQNQQDVTFAQEMIAHHTQAIDMAKLAPSRSTNPKVLDLASRIEKAQDPEIQQMQGWLTQWGAAAGPSSSSMPGTTSTGMSMPGMDHGSTPSSTGSMPGMMADADMTKLQQAKGAEFDKMFLEMMVQHHQGAIDMAKTELASGSNTDAKTLAQKIIDAQQSEITEMQNLLTQG